MPDSGPVVESTTTGSGAGEEGVTINPRSPGRDDEPDEIVRGFLEAMTATPAITTSVAREFLTREAASLWQPSETIIYAAASSPRGITQVSVSLTDARRTDGRGAWLGAVLPSDSTIDFPMTREDGQWRIAAVPNALIVPESWFEQRFVQASLYFFDPTGTVLVPDPVFVPRGRQLASALVNGLLAGPPSDSQGQLNFLPPLGESLSVPVSGSGLAQIDLSGLTSAQGPPSSSEAELLVSQLAWTLRQDPSIQSFQVSVGDRPVQLPDSETTFGVENSHGYAPYVAGSSTLLFGLRDGLMVGGSPQNLQPVEGPFGEPGYSLRSVSVDARAEHAAAVTRTGSEVLLGSVRQSSDPVTQVVSGAQDLLKPTWDFSGRLWMVDRREGGSVVSYLDSGDASGDPPGDLVALDVPGVSGSDVKDFLVSRDGSRLVAVLRHGADDDVVVVSRIVTDADGRVVRALPAVQVSDSGTPRGTIREIAWRSPTSMLVLHPLGRRLFQIRTVTVDGAPAGLSGVSVTLDSDVFALIGTPVPGESLYAIGPGTLVDLIEARVEATPIDDTVTELDYVG